MLISTMNDVPGHQVTSVICAYGTAAVIEPLG
jgi:hypothetical protein